MGKPFSQEQAIDEMHEHVVILCEALIGIFNRCETAPDGTWFVPIFLGGKMVQADKGLSGALQHAVDTWKKVTGRDEQP